LTKPETKPTKPETKRAFDPPVAIDVEVIDELRVLVATVGETPTSHKPCRVISTGSAYMRLGDGDFRLSDLEVAGFLANRSQPRFDQEKVPGVTRADLDGGLVADYCATAREASGRLGRIAEDDLLLVKTGYSGPTVNRPLRVYWRLPTIRSNGSPTSSFKLGQWMTTCLCRSASATRRATMVRSPSCSTMRKNGRDVVVRVGSLSDGTVRNVADLPAVVFREVIANALVHRDLAPWSWSRAVEMRFTPERFIVVNPGVSTSRAC
jgi:ATP-dependent DNA helicase RecG